MPPSSPRSSSFQKIAILGPGLLGGSTALAARKAGFDVTLWGRNPERVEAAQALGLAATTDLADAVSSSDLIILAVPVGVMEDLGTRLLPHLAPHALVTDVGSVKSLPHQVAALLRLPFIGSHPMAGSEQTGIEAARADLLQNAACIITTDDQADDETAIDPAPLAAFWTTLGCRDIEIMTAAAHDQAVARISHFPHAMAVLTADVALQDPAHGHLAGGGFRDTSRVASGDPQMWAEIMMENQAPLVTSLHDAQSSISTLLGFLEKSDQAGLEKYLADVKARKEHSAP